MSSSSSSSSTYSCNPCTPIQDVFEEYASDDDAKDDAVIVRNNNNKKFERTTSSTSHTSIFLRRLIPNFGEMISGGNFCHSGEILDDAAVEGTHAIRAIPRQGTEFVKNNYNYNYSQKTTRQQVSQQSQYLQCSNVMDGWTSSMATIMALPSAMSEYWNYHADIYHHRNGNGNNNNVVGNGYGSVVRSSELTLQY